MMKRKITAILAADVAEYSRLVAEDEEAALLRLEDYRTVFFDFVKRSRGRIVNMAGDAMLVEFDSAVEATRCAIDIQESLRTRNSTLEPDRQMQFRIGITIGDVVERGSDLLGDGVNIAARLESLAEPGGICISRSVYEQVANKVSVGFRDLGDQPVKNIPQPVHAFSIAWGTARLKPVPAKPLASAKQASPLVWMLAGAGILSILGLAATVAMLAGGRIDKPVVTDRTPIVERPPPAGPAQPGPQLTPPRSLQARFEAARQAEANGDALQARRDYLALAQDGVEAIDPYLRLAALIRVQEGRAGAREVLSGVMGQGSEAGKPSVAMLVHGMQFEGEERRRRIEAFLAARPEYAPAHFILAEDYGEDRSGSAQTLSDKRQESKALSAFLKADAEGSLPRFMLDQSLMAQWLDKARRRQAVLATALLPEVTKPSLTAMRSNAGWSITVQLPEAATALFWRLGEEGEMRPTGLLDQTDPRSGKRMVNPGFPLPGDVKAGSISLRYSDAHGVLSELFTLAFDPREALANGQRRMLETTANAWLALRQGPQGGEALLYYTHLMSYRCAIREARLGFDGGPLETVLAMPACNERDPYAIPAGVLPYLRLSRPVKSVEAQLTFSDGTQSAVQRFSP
jgi:class 3 adenylate cyclase